MHTHKHPSSPDSPILNKTSHNNGRNIVIKPESSLSQFLISCFGPWSNLFKKSCNTTSSSSSIFPVTENCIDITIPVSPGSRAGALPSVTVISLPLTSVTVFSKVVVKFSFKCGHFMIFARLWRCFLLCLR